MMQVVIATQNAGKLREFARILAPLGFEVVSQERVCPGLSVEETGSTFAENAALKARAVYERCGLACIADDSGLCVDALDGAPGVYSARYGGEQMPYPQKMQKLLGELEGLPVDYRSARFVAHICFIGADGVQLDVEGVCPGYIGAEPKGAQGFGYDPIFMVGEKSFSELDDTEKDAVSHRGKALRELIHRLKERYNKIDKQD